MYAYQVQQVLCRIYVFILRIMYAWSSLLQYDSRVCWIKKVLNGSWVVNPTCGQLKRENVFFFVPVRA